MRNYVQNGDILTVPAPRDLASGEGCLIRGLFGVSSGKVLTGDDADLVTRGVFTLPKATGALDIGQVVYWDDTAKKVTGTASGNTRIGLATSAALSGAATAAVKLTA